MSGISNGTIDVDASTAELTESDRHRLLASERRRVVLEVLDGSTASIALEELARQVAARESGRDVVDAEAAERVAVSLHHTHLPKMANLGVLRYDPVVRRIDPFGYSLDSLRTD